MSIATATASISELATNWLRATTPIPRANAANTAAFTPYPDFKNVITFRNYYLSNFPDFLDFLDFLDLLLPQLLPRHQIVPHIIRHGIFERRYLALVSGLPYPRNI